MEVGVRRGTGMQEEGQAAQVAFVKCTLGDGEKPWS